MLPPESILVVDDTPANLQLLARLLSKQGYKVRFAPDGELALASVRANLPDLILLDIMMPGMDGYEVCQRLKADVQTRDIPIIFLSALNESFDKVKAFNVGGVDYITKPFQVKEVIARIDSQLNLRRLQRQLGEQNHGLQAEIAERQKVEEERKQAKLALEAQLHRTLLIQQITEAIRSELDPQQIFATTAVQVGRAFGVDRCFIHTYNPSPLPEIPCVAQYVAPGYQPLHPLQIPLKSNPHAIQVLTQDAVVASPNVFADPLLQPMISLCQAIGLKSLLCIRTSYRGEPNGIIGLQQCGQFRQWTDDEIELLAAIAAQVGIAFAQANLLEQEQKQREVLDRQNLLLRQEIHERQQTETVLLQTSNTLASFTSNLKQLHRLSLTHFNQLEELLTDYLQTGCEMLDFTSGVVGRLQAETFEILAAQTEFAELTSGKLFSLRETFCGTTAAQGKTISYSHISQLDDLSQHPMRQSLKIESYIGTPIFVEDQIYGTLCFFSTQPRSGYHHYEQEIIELMAQSISKYLTTHEIEAKRKQAEASLQQSETRYRELVESQDSVLVCRWLADTRLTFVNQAYCRFFNHSSETLIGQRFVDLLPQEIQPEVEQYVQTICQDSISSTYEHPMVAADGQLRWFAWTDQPILDEDGNLTEFQSFGLDITEERLQEEALARRERYLEVLVDVQRHLLAFGGEDCLYPKILELLGQASTASRVYLFENNRDIAGTLRLDERAIWCHENAMATQSCQPLWSNSSHTDLFLRWYDILQRGDIVNNLATEFPEVEQVVLEQHGVRSLLILPLMIKGHFWGFIGFENCVEARIYDLSEISLLTAAASAISLHLERFQAEFALMQSERKYRNLVEASQDIIFSVDTAGRYTFINRAARQIFGYELAEIIGRPFAELLPPEHLQKGQQLFQLILQGEPCFQYELIHLTKEGRSIQLLLNAVLLRDEAGYPEGIMGTASDVTERKRLARELSQSQQLLDSIVENIPLALFVRDVKNNFRHVIWNQAAEKMYGVAREKAIGQTKYANLDAELANQFHAEDLQIIASGQPLFIEEEDFYHTTGQRRIQQRIMKVPLTNEQGEVTHLVGIAEDISERKRQEQALQLIVEGTAAKTGDEFFRLLVRYLAEVLQVRYALITQLVDAEKTTVRTLAFWQGNDFGENFEYHLAGTPCEQVLNGAVRFYPEAVLQQFPNYRLPAWAEVQSYLGVPLTDSTGSVLGHLKVLDNQPIISNRTSELILRIFAARAGAELERKLVEDALRESARRERAMLRVIERMRQTLDIEQIFRATTEELRYLLRCDRVTLYRFHPDWSGEFVAESVAAGWQPILQEQQEELDNHHCVDSDRCVVKTWERGNWIQDTYLQETRGGMYSQGSSYLAVKDIYEAGFSTCYLDLLERFQVRAYLTVPIFQGNKLWGLLASYQNARPRLWKATEISLAIHISSQLGVALQQAELLRQTQQQSTELEKARDAAEAANRAKSEFLANMSHELRTPLNAILGFTQIMSRDTTLALEHQQHLDIINRSGQHLLSLINDVLEMSKIEAGRVKLNENSFDLYRLLDSLEDMLRLKANVKQLTLTFQRTPCLPQFITTDENKLRQVLLNLLGNAIKFTESGYIKLNVELDDRRSTSDPRLINILFEIEDTGSGIAPDEIEHLFKAFVQTRIGQQAHEGTGLGLTISRKFVNLMGGDITVNSVLGQGSVFKFNIWAHSAEMARMSSPGHRRVIGVAPNQPTYRILIVENQWENRHLLVELLASLGFELREAENGQEGLALWEAWNPHLILMDMRMPVMNGYEATQQIKASAKGQATVIIAVTGSAFEENRSAILSVGCDDFIRKPVEQELLFAKIAEHLGVSFLYEDVPQRLDATAISTPILKGNDLAVMPPEWIDQLRQSASGCSDRQVLQLIRQIPSTYPTLAKALADLAYNFRFEEIVELAQSARQ